MESVLCLLRTRDWWYIRDMWRPRRSVTLFKVRVCTLRTIIFTNRDQPIQYWKELRAFCRYLFPFTQKGFAELSEYLVSVVHILNCSVVPLKDAVSCSMSRTDPINNCTLLYALIDKCRWHFITLGNPFTYPGKNIMCPFCYLRENVHFDWFNHYLCTGKHFQSNLDIFQFDFMFVKPDDVPPLLCLNVQTEMRFLS